MLGRLKRRSSLPIGSVPKRSVDLWSFEEGPSIYLLMFCFIRF
jgi:hypothetical protein